MTFAAYKGRFRPSVRPSPSSGAAFCTNPASQNRNIESRREGDRSRQLLSRASSARLLPLRLLCFLVSAASGWRMSFRLARGGRTACLHATPKGIHQVHNVGRLGSLRPLDRLAFLFLLQQLLERILVLILELLGIEVPRLRLHNMGRQVRAYPSGFSHRG